MAISWNCNSEHTQRGSCTIYPILNTPAQSPDNKFQISSKHMLEEKKRNYKNIDFHRFEIITNKRANSTKYQC